MVVAGTLTSMKGFSESSRGTATARTQSRGTVSGAVTESASSPPVSTETAWSAWSTRRDSGSRFDRPTSASSRRWLRARTTKVSVRSRGSMSSSTAVPTARDAFFFFPPESWSTTSAASAWQSVQPSSSSGAGSVAAADDVVVVGAAVGSANWTVEPSCVGSQRQRDPDLATAHEAPSATRRSPAHSVATTYTSIGVRTPRSLRPSAESRWTTTQFLFFWERRPSEKAASDAARASSSAWKRAASASNASSARARFNAAARSQLAASRYTSASILPSRVAFRNRWIATSRVSSCRGCRVWPRARRAFESGGITSVSRVRTQSSAASSSRFHRRSSARDTPYLIESPDSVSVGKTTCSLTPPLRESSSSSLLVAFGPPPGVSSDDAASEDVGSVVFVSSSSPRAAPPRTPRVSYLSS
mmetsp:Transcript_952/g.3774  ORF Transcript_952/g.3774 Transcript_952/m.3774 type:complete len:416 (+) Transcript_952:567-1814(+)